MDIIIFSKDRAFQLYTSLETIQKHVSNINNIYVQFAYSNEKYLAGYEKLNKIFNDVTFIDETLHGFQNTMYALLDSEVQSENVMLEVDDTIYYKDLDLIIQFLINHTLLIMILIYQLIEQIRMIEN